MKIKKILVSTTISTAIGFFSFSTLAMDNTNTTTSPTPAPNNQQVNNAKDGEVLAWLIVLNKNEIAAAKSAEKRHVNPDVKNYANMLSKEHSKNLQDTIKLGNKIGQSPVASSDSNALKQKGQEEMANMQPLDDQKFQVTFIDTMVTDHSNALDKIDKDYLPNVSNPQLKQHLQNTRDYIAKHLNQAKQIQSQMQQSPR